MNDLAELIECYWCSSPARISYHKVPLCTFHAIHLYLGINMVELRNRQ